MAEKMVFWKVDLMVVSMAERMAESLVEWMVGNLV